MDSYTNDKRQGEKYCDQLLGTKQRANTELC